MSNLQVDSVLAQIRALSAQVHGAGKAPLSNIAATLDGVAKNGGLNQTAGTQDFATLLKQGIDQVNNTQTHAAALATSFERGTPGVELTDVMIEMQKANVAFRALTEVRNRLVSAYQEVMGMQI